MKRLIVTCDDCGLSQGINAAALALHRQGIAQHASIMANGPAAQDALELFAPYPSFKLGVHFDLTEGSPLSRSPAPASLLAADGRFHSARHVFARASFSRAALAWMEQELSAQIEFFFARGIRPQHATTHLHFHLLSPLRALVRRLVERYHIPWLRPHQLRAVVAPFNPLLRLPPSPSNGITPDAPTYLAVVQHWIGYPPARLAAALARVPGTVELVVHPDLASDDSLPPDVRYSAAQRAAEMRYLERLWPHLPSHVTHDAAAR